MLKYKSKIWHAALATIVFVYCFIEASGDGDLLIFLSAAGDLPYHKNIYVDKYLVDYHYYYSVLFALLLKPFYALPFFWVKFGWLLLNMFLYIKSFQLLASSSLLEKLEEKQKTIFLVLVFIFSLRFLHENIHAAQITILIFWCCIYGLYFIHHNRPVLGSLILALGINIKLLPVVFLPYLFYRGYFKAFVFTLSFYLISLFAPSLIIGNDYNMTLLKSWLSLINPAKQQHILDVDERSFHGISTLLSTLLVKEVPDYYALPIRRNIADVSLSTLPNILLSVRLILALFTLYFLKWGFLKKEKSDSNTLIGIAYLLLLIPLIFPHQQHYAFLFIVPAFALVLYHLQLNYKHPSKPTKQIIITLLILIYLCGNLKLILGEFNEYYEHFKILTYGGLLLIPLLVWTSRKISMVS